MNKCLLVIASLLLVSTTAAAADVDTLPEIAPYDDAGYYPLSEVVSADFDGLTTPVAGVESTEIAESNIAEDNGGLPDISATEDESYEALADVVKSQ